MPKWDCVLRHTGVIKPSLLRPPKTGIPGPETFDKFDP